MKDQQRADRLARAIEQMAQGRMPEDVDDDELQELLVIARIRMDAAGQSTEAGGEAQHSVLERLLARLHAQNGERSHEEPEEVAANEIAEADDGSDEMSVGELQDVINLRRRMAEQAAELSEAHRDSVWRQVQARIHTARSEKRGFFRWPFARRDREADEFGAALDRMTLGEPIWEARDSRLEELLQVARLRQAALATAGSGSGFVDHQARVWSRIRPRLMARQMLARRPQVFRRRELNLPPWPKLAAAGAAIALAVAILGPMPATGFAQHPVVELVQQATHVGVSETTTPPEAVPPVTRVVESNDVSVAEASELMGVSVSEPTTVPDGYTAISSQYFPEGITSDEGGLFVLAYEKSNPSGEPSTILVYQELASSTNITVQEGYAQDVGLVDADVSATYVNGTWRASEGGITWGDEGAQTIVFDHDGVRGIIQTDDADMAMSELAAIATSMVEEAPTD